MIRHIAGLAALSLLCATQTVAAAPKFTVIYNFEYSRDGASPLGLIVGRSGVLYGVASYGAPDGCGAVFRLTPSTSARTNWTYKLLHVFNSDGCGLRGRLVEDPAGALFGTTASGSFASENYRGSLFKLSPPAGGQGGGQGEWAFSTLAEVGVQGNGTFLGDLALHRGGVYGTLNGNPGEGATRSFGSVFQWTPQFGLREIWTFDGAAGGGHPTGGVLGHTVDGVFSLFGTTSDGGAHGRGTVFRVIPPGPTASRGVGTTLFSFTGGADGGNASSAKFESSVLEPSGGLAADRMHRLYGTTTEGGIRTAAKPAGLGVAFRLAPPAPGQTNWTETVLHAFKGGADGSVPLGTLIDTKGSVLYGTSVGPQINPCGPTEPCGTVFKLTPADYGGGAAPWHEVVLHRFGGHDLPWSILVEWDDPDGTRAFYGTTRFGGTFGYGTIFRLTP